MPSDAALFHSRGAPGKVPAVAAADTGTTTVVFNSRCPHRVGFNPQDDGKRRMGIGSSVGRAPDGSLVLWS